MKFLATVYREVTRTDTAQVEIEAETREKAIEIMRGKIAAKAALNWVEGGPRQIDSGFVVGSPAASQTDSLIAKGDI